MIVSPTNNFSAWGGRTGEREDFLGKCGVFALPTPSEEVGRTQSAGAPSLDHSPALAPPPRENESAGIPESNEALSRSPGDSTQEKLPPVSSTDWTVAAHQLIDAIPAEEHRQSLIDYFEETAAFIEFEQGQARPLAEQQAFGQLMFEMLRRGIDARAAR